jgi:hypothetical protein
VNQFAPAERSALNEVEEYLKARFDKNRSKPRVPSNSLAAPGASSRLDSLILKDEERGRLPETKDKYLVRENPHLVAWEREVRKFLRKLNPDHGHRVAGAMIFEWATGLSLKDLHDRKAMPHADLRKINKILEFYFGKPYMTYILGRKVPKAYRVPPGWYVSRHRPMTLTLFHEYSTKTLNP